MDNEQETAGLEEEENENRPREEELGHSGLLLVLHDAMADAAAGMHGIFYTITRQSEELLLSKRRICLCRKTREEPELEAGS